MATAFEQQFTQRSLVLLGVLAVAGVAVVVFLLRRRRK